MIPTRAVYCLADVPAEFRTDSHKSAIDIAGSVIHPGGGRQSDKHDDQQVFDQSLASLVIVKLREDSKQCGHTFLLNFAKISTASYDLAFCLSAAIQTR
jgi:hypothetical protein